MTDDINDRIARAIAAATVTDEPRRRRPAIDPNAAVDPNTPLRLADAVAVAFPHGGMTISGLRREANRGRLVIEKIAGKDFVTLAAIERMRGLCRDDANRQDCGSNQKNSTRPETASATAPGSSETDRAKSALAALHKTARELKPRSPNTSPSSTAPPRESAAVIPLKSSSLMH
jgi:hypothetical protein